MKQIITGLIIVLISLSAKAQTRLSWETKNLKNSEWTQIVLQTVEKNYQVLNSAKDMDQFCPNYKNLGMQQRIDVWGEFFSALAFFESGWNPNCQYTESYLGIDEITGLPVVSEGLLQVSYSDVKWANWCQFNWEADKKVDTFNTSILNPKNNLECGIGIMARQIKKHEKITLEKGVYWSTLRINGQRNKVQAMAKMIKTKYQYCGK